MCRKFGVLVERLCEGGVVPAILVMLLVVWMLISIPAQVGGKTSYGLDCGREVMFFSLARVSLDRVLLSSLSLLCRNHVGY